MIRGSAINQDGRTNGLTAPNGLAQQAVVRQALADGGVDPGDDRPGRGARHRHAPGRSHRGRGAGRGAGPPVSSRCLLGSAKTNIGHLEAAAGIAGLIKVVLSLQHEAVPGSSTSAS